MKILLKTIALTAIFVTLFFIKNANAQTTPAGKFNLNFGLEGGIPNGDAGSSSTFTLGAAVRLQYGITDRLAATFTTGGYVFLPGISPYNGSRYAAFEVIPVKAGLKYFFIPNIYFGAEAGVGRQLTKSGDVGDQNKFLWTPGIGYANKNWDFGIRYEGLRDDHFNYGFVGLRMAYGFGL